MFGSLKEKLKGWLSKNQPEEEKEELVETKEDNKKQTKKPIKTDSKKTKKETAKPKKESKKIKEKELSKKETIKEEKSPKKEVEEEPKIIEEKPTEKKSFFGLFKKKETSEDKIIEEIESPIEEPKDSKENLEKEEKESSEEKIESPVEEKKPEEKKSFFDKFTKKLDEEKFEDLFSELELILFQNNVAYTAVEKIKDSLRKKLVGKSLKEVDLAEELKDSIKSLLINPPNFIQTIKTSLKEKSPFVIVFAGINGSGKTTTIAKVAHLLKKNNLSVCLAAADTFRAAAIQQLEEHSIKLKIPIIKKDYGSDPAAVGFDAISYAKKHKIDVVLIDTAGRMQNRDSLMKEMEKITRVNSPDMKIFLGESITGNDATEQAKTFNETIDLTGIILSKADVDEKGGTAISVTSVTNKPIFFLGTGQTYDDLEAFDKDKMIEKLGL